MSDTVVLALIAAVPSTIAAVSSLLNHRKIDAVRTEQKEVKATLEAVANGNGVH